MADVIDEPMVEAFARLALKASLAHPRVTWGRAPRKYFGRNRLWPRPQNPPGARRLRPFSRYPFTYIPAVSLSSVICAVSFYYCDLFVMQIFGIY
jgi:hypothetical protein